MCIWIFLKIFFHLSPVPLAWNPGSVPVEVALAGAEKQVKDQCQHLCKAKEQLAIALEKIESQQKELERKEELANISL